MPAIGTVYQPGQPGPVYNPGPIAAPQGGPMSQTQSAGGSWNQGGGWNQFATSPGTPQYALQQAFSQGLTGQAAVDAANSSLGLQPPNSISYGADGSYGLPNGFYVAPNAQNGGALDLIQRGGGGGGGSSSAGGNQFGGGFSFDPNSTSSSPGYQFALQQALNGAQANKAAQGTLLGTGAQKDLMQWASGVASQWEPTLFNQALQGYQANFGDLYSLANMGYGAAGQTAGYQAQAGNANAGGIVGSSNAQNQGLGGVNAAANQAYYQGLYGQNNNQPWSTWSGSTTLDTSTVAPGAPGNQGEGGG